MKNSFPFFITKKISMRNLCMDTFPFSHLTWKQIISFDTFVRPRKLRTTFKPVIFPFFLFSTLFSTLKFSITIYLHSWANFSYMKKGKKKKLEINRGKTCDWLFSFFDSEQFFAYYIFSYLHDASGIFYTADYKCMPLWTTAVPYTISRNRLPFCGIEALFSWQKFLSFNR